jgi:hypothetical protein
MMFLAFARRTLALVALLAAFVATAHADRGATLLDESQHARVPASLVGQSASAHHAPSECGSCVGSPSARNVPPASFSPAAAPHAPGPAAPARPAEKREHARTSTPATVLHTHRPTAQRSKSAARNTPATPGMGTLLRFGAAAGREISVLIDCEKQTLSTRHSGRAPPAGRGNAPHASALPPFGSPTAAIPFARHELPGAACPAAPTSRPFERSAPRESDRDPARRAPSVDGNAPPALRSGASDHPRAARVKGATACSLTPFGGSHA